MSQFDIPTTFDRHQLITDDRPDGSSELQTLQEISRTILDSLDLKVMMEGILNKASKIGGFDIGMICFVTRARQTLEPVAHCGFRNHENLTMYREHMREHSTAGIVDRVIATKEIHVVELHKTEGIRTFRREEVRSLVVIPLRTDQDALGIMYLGSRQHKEFEPGKIRLFEAIGTQAGIAVQKIRLFEAMERRAKEQEALNVIATATNQSLDLKELFEIAAYKTVMVTERQRINFRLKDPLTGKVELVAYRGFTEEEIAALRRNTPHEMSEQVFASGDPLVINHHVRSGVAGLLARTQSVAWIPVKAGSKVVGVLGISDDQSRPFTPNEVELLKAIGSVIGVAIENARLFEQTRRQAVELEQSNKAKDELLVVMARQKEELSRLNAMRAVEEGAQDYLFKGQTDGHLLARSLRYAIQRHRAEETLKERNRELLILQKISETILGSLHLKAVLEKILEETMVSDSFDLGNIRLLDRSREMLEVVAGRGYRDAENVLGHRELARRKESRQSKFGDRLFREPCVEENLQQCGGYRTLKKEGVESFIMVPVRANGEVVGTLQLATRTPRKFKPEELNLLQTIGNQLGIAVQKAQLHEETLRQALELEGRTKCRRTSLR